MPQVTVRITIEKSPAEVWEYVKDISRHTEWMTDADSITFTSEARAGVNTTFECLTKVGPLRTTDVMTITSWEPNRRMGVKHEGVVTGRGDFYLEEVTEGTEFRWEEELDFPWFFGGNVGEFAAKPVLEWIWKRNLKNLKDCLEN